ncbi:MAG: glycosyl hydrolase family 18 protein, partial [Methylotetracoccus sp.]|nr:glycosyl hydrolase family 18 protein [Methylotetracoccus sp.]
MDSPRFVFFDFHGKRTVFVRSVFVLPKLRKPEMLSRPEAAFHVPSHQQAVAPPSPQPPGWLHRKKAGSFTATPRREAQDDEPVLLAFYENGESASFSSLQTHYRKITHVSPDWFSMRSFEQPLVTETDDELVDFTDASGVKLLPMLRNLEGDEWRPEIVEDLARHPEKRQRYFQELREQLQNVNAAGVLIDWEQLDPAYRSEVTTLLTRLAEFLHEESLELWLGVPIGRDVAVFDLDALAPAVDRFVALLYDENDETDAPGPVGSLPWWTEWSEVLLAHGTPRQWVLAIGNYGYDWSSGESAATLSFADSMARARHGGDRPVTAETPLYHPHFGYEEHGRAHTVWFLDAVTFRNQYKLAAEKQAGGVALYRLGTEDPSLWQVVAHPQLRARHLEKVEAAERVANIGAGDLLTASNEREPGRREIGVSTTDLWTERYAKVPKGPLLYHRGSQAPDQVVLSFDDGPDPLWTPAILDILNAEGVRAVF